MKCPRRLNKIQHMIRPSYVYYKHCHISYNFEWIIEQCMKLLWEYSECDSSHHNLDFQSSRDPQGVILSTVFLSWHGKYSVKHFNTKQFKPWNVSLSYCSAVVTCLWCVHAGVSTGQDNVDTYILHQIKSRSCQQPSIYLAQSERIRRQGLHKSLELSIVVD